MNFVTRNLGWILLLLFFIFMLFIISSNEGNAPSNGTGTISALVDLDDNQEDLDVLVEKLKEDEKVKIGDASQEAEKIEAITSNEAAMLAEDKKEKKGFFSFLKWGKTDSKDAKDEGKVENASIEELLSLTGSEVVDSEDKNWRIVDQTKQDLDTQIIVESKDAESQETDESTDNEETAEEIEEEIAEEKEEKKSLFAKIFGKNEKEEVSEKEINATQTGSEEKTESGTVISENNAKQETVTPREELIGMASTDTNTAITENVMKKTQVKHNVSYADIRRYAPEVLSDSAMYPGLALETEPGKDFEIGVHSLRLNNASFNKTLAYMMRGDTITQMTEENEYGCFLVRIKDSQRAYNNGKTGYVCKKYLTQAMQDEVIIEPAEAPAVEIVVNTQVGDFIIIEKSNVMLGDTILNIGDTIDQMSTADGQGCFTAHVYNSSNELNLGKIGRVCVGNLY